MRTCCIFVNGNERGYFSTEPQYNEQKAKALVAELGLKYEQSEKILLNLKWPCSIDPSSEESILAPSDHFFQLGVYDDGVIYSDSGARGSVEKPHATVAQHFIEKLPDSEIFIFEMERGTHGHVHYIAYALYQNGQEVRAFVGEDKAHGKPVVKIDRGAPLSEEKPFFEKSFIQDGKRIFRHELTEAEQQRVRQVLGEKVADIREVEYSYAYTAGQYLSHAIASRFLGCPLTEFRGKIYLERFRKPEPDKGKLHFWKRSR